MSPHGRQDDSEGGFTLIEVMAAMAVFVVVSAATVAIVILGLRTVRENTDRVTAANIARTQVEWLRQLGAGSIPIGQSTATPSGTDSRFSVTTTANWTGIGQGSATACAAAQPGQSYLRVHVDVVSDTLSGPQSIDTVIVPGPGTAKTGGALTVSITDQFGSAVSGVTVRATDAQAPTNAFTLTTGNDGCLYVPGLSASTVLTVTASKSGYVSPSPLTNTVTIGASGVTRTTFQMAAAARIGFAAADPAFALPGALPVTWQFTTTGATPQKVTGATVVSGQWPATTGFAAWPGTCADADPQRYAVARTSFALTAGALTTARLVGPPVLIRGLPAAAAVTATYAGTDVTCSKSPIAIGVTDAKGQLKVTMPYGNWSFTASGQTQGLASALRPAANGAAPALTTVNFTVANLDATTSPSPSPSPSVTP